jgi:hypothetical protein
VIASTTILLVIFNSNSTTITIITRDSTTTIIKDCKIRGANIILTLKSIITQINPVKIITIAKSTLLGIKIMTKISLKMIYNPRITRIVATTAIIMTKISIENILIR